jgi:hypothetical protein
MSFRIAILKRTLKNHLKIIGEEETIEEEIKKMKIFWKIHQKIKKKFQKYLRMLFSQNNSLKLIKK